MKAGVPFWLPGMYFITGLLFLAAAGLLLPFATAAQRINVFGGFDLKHLGTTGRPL